MRLGAQPRRERVRVDAVDGERDDPAPLDAEVVQRDARERRASCVAQRRRRASVTRCRDRVDAERERVVDGRAEPEPVGDAVLPRLEPARVVADLDARRRATHCAACTSRNGGSSRSIHGAPHVEQAGARAAPRRYLRPVAERKSQPSASTSIGSWPAAWHASSRYGHAGLARHRADRGGRVHEPALRRDPRDRDQAHAVVEHRRAARRPRAARARRRGSTSTRAPVRCATCRNAITLLAYSARDVRMRSPGANDAASA